MDMCTTVMIVGTTMVMITTTRRESLSMVSGVRMDFFNHFACDFILLLKTS